MITKDIYVYTMSFQGNERVVTVHSNLNGTLIPIPLIYKTLEDAKDSEVLKTIQKLCDDNHMIIELSQYSLIKVTDVFHGNNMNTH